jgi:hypothetical protein
MVSSVDSDGLLWSTIPTRSVQVLDRPLHRERCVPGDAAVRRHEFGCHGVSPQRRPMESAGRNRTMQRRLRRYDVGRWGGEFLTSLVAVREAQERVESKLLSPARQEKLARYRTSQRRLLFLDYAGRSTDPSTNAASSTNGAGRAGGRCSQRENVTASRSTFGASP